MEPDDPSTWGEWAQCRSADPETFFPDKGGSTHEAKRLCAKCPIQRICLLYAVEHEERFGVWGGFSERERRAMAEQARTPEGRQAVRDLIVSTGSLVEEVERHVPAHDQELRAEIERTRRNLRRAYEEVQLS